MLGAISHTVLVLGAGASLAQAISHRPMRRSEHPPLDADFFERAQALAKKDRRIADSIRRLQEQSTWPIRRSLLR